jgi:hypothetical protein
MTMVAAMAVMTMMADVADVAETAEMAAMTMCSTLGLKMVMFLQNARFTF